MVYTTYNALTLKITDVYKKYTQNQMACWKVGLVYVLLVYKKYTRGMLDFVRGHH